MQLEIESLGNNNYCFQYAADDSIKLMNNLKSFIPKKTTQVNAPPTFVAPFHEPLTTSNDKKADYLKQ